MRRDSLPGRAKLGLVLGYLGLAVTVSCDRLTGPPPPPVAKPGIPSQPSLTGEIPPPPGYVEVHLQIPETNVQGGGVDWMQTQHFLPYDHWMRVKVKQAIALSANPEYTNYYCGNPCVLPLDGSTAYPPGVDNGKLRARVAVSGRWGFIELTPTAVAGEPDTYQIDIYGGGTLYVARTPLFHGGSCYAGAPATCDANGQSFHEAGAYRLSGYHVVSATPIAPNLGGAAGQSKGDRMVDLQGSDDGLTLLPHLHSYRRDRLLQLEDRYPGIARLLDRGRRSHASLCSG